MLNIRQTSLYADFMRRINWQVEEIDGVYFFIKKIPLLPAVVKIQRPNHLPAEDKLELLMRKYHASSIVVEPNFNLKLEIGNWKLVHDPYIHTKTLHIDLTADEQTIFNRLTPAKRRAVRRAQKLGVAVEVSDDIESFIRLKNRTTGFFLGFLATRGFLRPLWQTFAPDYARVLLAFLPRTQSRINLTKFPIGRIDKKIVAGILLLYLNKVAYYWMAAASETGKKHFAPTLLVWEALKFSKSQGCTVFDFEGVFDERFPKKSRDWQGFSRFKEGFGGDPVYYPQPFRITL